MQCLLTLISLHIWFRRSGHRHLQALAKPRLCLFMPNKAHTRVNRSSHVFYWASLCCTLLGSAASRFTSWILGPAWTACTGLCHENPQTTFLDDVQRGQPKDRTRGSHRACLLAQACSSFLFWRLSLSFSRGCARSSPLWGCENSQDPLIVGC